MALDGLHVLLGLAQTAFQSSYLTLKHKGPAVSIKTRQCLGSGEKSAQNVLSYKCVTHSELYVTNI